MFHAILGGGAYLKGMRIWPAATADLSESVISLEHRVYQDLPPETVSAIAHAAQKVRTAMTCGLEMCYVACGRIDAVVKLDQAFYDYIGGALILSEALQGKRGLIDLMTRENILPFTHLGCRVSFLASNGLVSNELLRILK
jgi:fructose-1,6-bisphosphatase/inositol monophosphatase family enzyme